MKRYANNPQTCGHGNWTFDGELNTCLFCGKTFTEAELHELDDLTEPELDLWTNAKTNCETCD